jgi:hypothetical protein
MKNLMVGIFLLGSLSWGSVVTVPYTSGKIAQSVTVGTRGTYSPDSVRVGSQFILRFYRAPSALTVCGAPTQLVLQVLVTGSARRRPDNDTNWMAYTGYPQASSMINLDSMGPVQTGPNPYGSAPAYAYGTEGQFNTCMGATYSLAQTYQQIVFVQSGTTYAKFRIFTYSGVDESVTPLLQFYYLNSISIRMVVSGNANDLVDPNPPVAIRGNFESRSRAFSNGSERARVAHDLYNPLGIRLVREPGRFEAVLPGPATGSTR